MTTDRPSAEPGMPVWRRCVHSPAAYAPQVCDHCLRAAERAAAEEMRERAARAVELYLHTEAAIGPTETTELDRVAAYNNKTCKLAAAEIRSLPLPGDEDA